MQKPFYVYIGNTLVETVTFDAGMNSEMVRNSLINHDGYDPRIEVEQSKRKTAKEDYPMPKPAYLVTMTGQGDAYVALVGQDVFDWIGASIPAKSVGEYSWNESDIAPECVTREDGEIYITVGSFHNDRALAAMEGGTLFSNHLGDEDEMADDIASARSWAQQNGYEIVGDWHGGIY